MCIQNWRQRCYAIGQTVELRGLCSQASNELPSKVLHSPLAPLCATYTDSSDAFTALRWIDVVAAATEDVSFGRLHFLDGDARSTMIVALGTTRTAEVVLQAGLAACPLLTNVSCR